MQMEANEPYMFWYCPQIQEGYRFKTSSEKNYLAVNGRNPLPPL